MRVYDERSKEGIASRRQPSAAVGEPELEPLLPRPRPVPPAVAAEPPAPQPRAAWSPGGGLSLRPLGTPLQRRARLGLHWAALEHRCAQPDPEGLAGRLEARRGRGTPLPAALQNRLEAQL
ncbi:hypothetical protein, partial [Calidithermus chliarophilus]|uniref:hypothetical protein n=1 Tax=Calidithermus chliarophilus TaxID=52023 RepID=UPI001C54D346